MYQPNLDPTNFKTKLEMDPEKQLIINLFMTNVKGQTIDTSGSNKKHNGKKGHWLESRMGIARNAKNAPDLHGYELKHAASIISFGDWCATEYLFSKKNKEFLPKINMTRDAFFKCFGTPKPAKNGRVSWTRGESFPKCVGDYNECGQKLVITDDGSVVVYYSRTHDKRPTKPTLGDSPLPIAYWSAEKLKRLLLNKFGVNGFCICTEVGGTYQKIGFGKPISFEFFVEQMRLGNIYIDPSMHEEEKRNRCTFRATLAWWKTLITEEY
jgi:hypothetical protein